MQPLSKVKLVVAPDHMEFSVGDNIESENWVPGAPSAPSPWSSVVCSALTIQPERMPIT